MKKYVAAFYEEDKENLNKLLNDFTFADFYQSFHKGE